MSYSLLTTLGAAFLVASLSGCNNASVNDNEKNISKTDVIDTYANIALATFEDSLTEAEVLHTSIKNLIATPTETNLNAAKLAWLAARVPYQQSEAYRFGNPVVDAWARTLR